VKTLQPNTVSNNSQAVHRFLSLPQYHPGVLRWDVFPTLLGTFNNVGK